MTNRIFKACAWLLAFLSCSMAFAQVADIEFYKKKYPNKAFVYLSKTTDFDLSVKDNKLVILRHYKEQRLLLTDAAKSIDTRKISTNEFVEVKNVKARVLVPDGKRYNKIEVTGISLKEEGSDESFYDGEKQYILKYPFTLPGNILEMEYDEVYNEPRFFGSVFISDYFPIISYKINMKMPASAKLTIKNVNNQGLKYGLAKSLKKSDSLMTWSYDTLEPLAYEEYSADIKHYASYILMKVESYQTPDNVSHTLLRNTDDLYQWYSGLTKNLNQTEDAQLKMLTDSLTSGARTDEEKMKNIFYWVQDKIAYVAYEDGLGGYIPREAPVICKRRFGDCKDMASLIVRMGQIAHLKVYHTWIGTRSIPYVFSDFPSPFCANHMIATFIDDKGNYIFLDGTGKYTPFGVPTEMIQGKQAFIGIGEKEYKLATVPVISSDRNYVTDSVICSVKKNNLSGYGYFKANGYIKTGILRYLSNKPAKELKEYFTDLLSKGNNKFKVDSFSVLQQSKELPLIVYYTFTLPDYLVSSDKNMYVNLNFDKDYLKDLKTSTRKTPIELDFNSTKNLDITMQLEKDEKADFLPAEGKGKTEIGSYHTRYTAGDRTVHFESCVTLDMTFIGMDKFPALSAFVTDYNRTTNKSLSITKTP